jgi:alanine racemase
MALLYFDYDIATIQSRMLLFPVEMRLKVKTESIIVVLSMIVTVLIFSLENRIGFLESQKIPQKTVILSDIFQSGLSNEELYSKVSQLIISITLLSIGETI